MFRLRSIILVSVLGLLLAGCSAPIADKLDLQTQIAESLSSAIGTTSRPQIKCEKKLPLEAGNTTTCDLVNPADNLTYEVTVTVVEIDANNVPTYSFKVADNVKQ